MRGDSPLRRNSRAPGAEIREKAGILLEKVGLGKEYDSLPSDLSGGMRKRAGLARALAVDPEILLVDEPSAGLDPITSGEIDQLLFDIKTHSKVTLVVVTHNILSARRLADQLAFLNEGSLLQQGTVEQLEQSEHQLIRDFMKSQQSG